MANTIICCKYCNKEIDPLDNPDKKTLFVYRVLLKGQTSTTPCLGLKKNMIKKRTIKN